MNKQTVCVCGHERRENEQQGGSGENANAL